MAVALIYKTKDGELDVIQLDAAVKEMHTSEADVTEHPVETGADVTDHVRKKPDRVQVEGVVTDSPLPHPSVFGPAPLPAKGRALEVHAQLLRLQATGTTFEIRSSLRTYVNMLLTSIGSPRDKSTKNAAQLTLQFREVRFVDTQLVPIKVTKLRKAQGKQNTGKQTGTAATPAEKRKSILATLVDKGGDVISSFSKPEVQ